MAGTNTRQEHDDFPKRMIPGEYEVHAITQKPEGASHAAEVNSGADRFEDSSVDETTAAEHRKEGGGRH